MAHISQMLPQEAARRGTADTAVTQTHYWLEDHGAASDESRELYSNKAWTFSLSRPPVTTSNHTFQGLR